MEKLRNAAAAIAYEQPTSPAKADWICCLAYNSRCRHANSDGIGGGVRSQCFIGANLRYGILLTVGDLGTVAELAELAEGAGWDGVFN
jgi:hypothetical protein